MDLDDEQVVRHAARELAGYLVIFRSEMRTAGLPDVIVDQLVLRQYDQLQAQNAASALEQALQKMAEAIATEPDEGA